MSSLQGLHCVLRSGLSLPDSFHNEAHGEPSFEEQGLLVSTLALWVLNGIFNNCVSFPFAACLLCPLNFRYMVWAKVKD